MSKKIKLSLVFLSLFVFIVAANSVLAADFGVNQVSNTISLSQGDPRVIVGRLIQIILSFLGVIALVLIMYAGFLWLTSGGEEEKVNQAKKILSNAIIGLVIILSSWGIATFLLNRISQATGTGTGNFSSSNNGNFSNQGSGAIGACSVETYYPSDGQKDVPRNSSILITFKEELKLDSVCSDGSGAVCACNKTNCNKLNPEAIRIFKKDLGDACSKGICLKPNSNITDVVVNVTDSNKTLVLTSVSPLGSPSSNTEYSVKFSNQLKKLDGNSMFKSCSTDYFEYSFTVSTSLDLTPPQVSLNGIFPLPDNSVDVRTEIAGKQALATINLSGSACPHVYTPAKLISVTPEGPEVTGIFEKTIKKFKLSVPATAPDKLELFDGDTNQALGIASFDGAGVVIFPDRLSLKIPSHKAGDLWTIIIEPEIFPDTLTIGQDQYTFVSGNDSRAKSSNYIVVPETCSLDELATNIQAKLSGNTNIIITRVVSTNILNLNARSAGIAGNDLNISSTAAALKITPFSGGINAEEKYVSQDKPDRPMNSALQINFNEAINPLTVPGSASEVSNYIRIVNARASSSIDKAVCSVDSDCRSYKCSNNVCVGNFLGGKFMVSNQYRTLEFISDRECGVNACGEKIYCFPANSNLSVELMAANLKTCTSNNDCLALGAFNNCNNTSLGYKTCQDSTGKNYPLARLDELDGIVDTAVNSLDGNRDLNSDGPLSFYFENNQSTQNVGKKDKYKWSFYIGGKIMLTPPKITFLSHPQGKKEVNLKDPIQINFNALMLNSSLHTGSSIVQIGSKIITHKSINLTSSSPSPLGYWISSENQDSAPLDGEPDLTIVKIDHSPFSQSMNYEAQIGSGVKDIYQNCFKPSGDQSCGVSSEKPSCCFGVATDILGADGNCK